MAEFDDIPVLSDEEVAQGGFEPVQQEQAVPAQDFSNIPEITPEEAKAGGFEELPESSVAGTVARRGVHGAMIGAGALPAIGAGAAIGAGLGSFGGPLGIGIGTFAGAVAGGFAGAEAMERASDYLLEKMGLRDGEGFFSRKQEAADKELHPDASFYSELAGQVVPAFTSKMPAEVIKRGAQTLTRVVGGGAMGGLEAGSELYQEGKVDVGHVAAAFLAGAAFPTPRAWAEKAINAGGNLGKRIVPGKTPATPATPATEAARTETENTPAQNDGGIGTAKEASKPVADWGEVGFDESLVTPAREAATVDVVRSEQQYSKSDGVTNQIIDKVTRGEIKPDVAEALKSPSERMAEGVDLSEAGPKPETAKPGAADEIKLSTVPPESLETLRRIGMEEVGLSRAEVDATINQPDATVKSVSEAFLRRAQSMQEAKARTEATLKGGSVQPVQPVQPKSQSSELSTAPRSTPTQEVSGAGGTKAIEAAKATRDLNNPRNWPKPKFDENGVLVDRPLVEQVKGTEGTKPPVTLPKSIVKPVTAAVTHPMGDSPHKIVREAETMMKAAGNEEGVKQLRGLPVAEQIARADMVVRALTNKKGEVPTAPQKNPRNRAAQNKNKEVNGVQMRTVTEANTKRKALDAIEQAYNEHTPPKDGKETPEQLMARASAAYERAKELNDGKNPVFKMEKNSPPHLDWMREMVKLSNTKEPNAHAIFQGNENLIRGGEEGHKLFKETRRVAADVGMSRAAGDAALASAESKIAKKGPEPLTEPELNAIWDEVRGDQQAATPDAAPSKELTFWQDRKAEVEAQKKRLTPKDYANQMADAEAGLERAKREFDELQGTPVDPTKPLPGEGLKDIDATQKALDALVTPIKQTKEKAPFDKAEAADKGKSLALDEKNLQWAKESIAKAEQRKKSNEPQALPAEKLKNSAAKLWENEEGGVNVTKVIDWLKNATAPSKDHVARAAKSDAEVYARSLSDGLHIVYQKGVNRIYAIADWMKSMPEKFGNAKVQEDIYRAVERGEVNKLDPEVQAFYNKEMRPVFEQLDKLYYAIEKLMPGKLGPKVKNYVYRIRKGDTADVVDMFSTEGRSDPVEGVRGFSTGRKGPMFDRTFFNATDTKTGERRVISVNEEGFSFWDKGTATKVKDEAFKYEDGKLYNHGGKEYRLGEALTKEIKDNAKFDNGKPADFYENAMLSSAVAHKYLGDVAAHLQYLEGLKESPSFQQKANSTLTDKAKLKGWVQTKHPQFKNWYMDPQLAHVFDDFAKPGFDTPQWARDLSQGVTKLIFWNPIPHILNVGTHWWVQRGWSWIAPEGYRSLAVDGMTAIKSVISQDALQTTLRSKGAGTIYGGVGLGKFMDVFANAAKISIERNTAKWDPIARTLGMGPSDLARAIYKSSSKIMWAVNDMLMTQAYLEHMRKGHTMEEAIVHVERHIPNYRIPATVLGSGDKGRFLSKIMSDPLLTAFGRYHYAVFNSYAHIVKNLVGGNDAQRSEAIGNLFAMGLFAMIIKPVFDKMATIITGKKDAEMQARGPFAIPHHLTRVYKGKEDIGAAIRSTLTLPPATATTLDVLRNQDFTGKPIRHATDEKKALHGDAKAAGRVALQVGTHAARGIVSPYGTYVQGAARKENPAETIRNQLLDIKVPNPRARRFEQKTLPQQARQDIKRPNDPLKKLYRDTVGH